MRQKLIKSLIVGLAALFPVTGTTQTKAIPYVLYNAASHFNLDVTLLYAICRVESNCKASAINRDDGTDDQKAAGIKSPSYGMFQIKLSTAKSLGFVPVVKQIIKTKRKTHVRVINKTKSLLTPEVNTWYAAKYIKHLYGRYHDTASVISAYNAGHPTSANKAYVDKVLRNYIKYKIDKRF